MELSKPLSVQDGMSGANRLILSLAILLGALILHGCEGTRIDDVDSLADLKKCELIHLNKQCDIRVGMAKDPGGPWIFVYCLSDNHGEESQANDLSDSGGMALGPVSLVVVNSDEAIPVSQRMNIMGKTHWDGLFCVSAVTAWPGKYTVKVLNYQGKQLASRTLRVSQIEPCFWQEFATRRQDPKRYVVRADPAAAIPSFNESTLIDCLSDGLVGSTAGTSPDHRGDRSFPLDLSLSNGKFVIHGRMKMANWPDFYVLARWWVNGKPIRANLCRQMRLTNIGAIIGVTPTHEIEFGLPMVLGPLKVGDKIGLQILYSPASYRQIPVDRQDDMAQIIVSSRIYDASTVPLLSNPIEWTVTREMLEGYQSGMRPESH